ncbi:MAG: pilus assembly protein [Candidatus Dormibacteraeota bacterium]|nr:pilus assembly protein [Candidatus Dormibacteraeota bacterium]MBV9525687.1 pilus assembly protein [Candidatus Dormibacteraeota bacterium]
MTRRCRMRGQSMVELAIVLPVLVTVFLGSWTAADLIADNNAAAQATRAGARYAAEIGNNGYSSSSTASGCQTSAKDPCAVDAQIIDQMLPIVTSKLTSAVVTEIDIYQPSGSGNGCNFSSGSCPPNNGDYCCGELLDKYTISGSTATLSGSANYTLDQRVQTHPTESELGVRLVFTYTSPTLRVFTQTDSQYSVIRLAPS